MTTAWDTETVEHLAEIHRNNEVIEGVIRSIKFMYVEKMVDGKPKTVQEQTLLIALPGGITGLCPVSEFRERIFKTYTPFITHKESFVISNLDTENQKVMLSANAAADILRKEFWNEIDILEESGMLEDHVFTATVTSYNELKNVVHARISGQDVYMYRSEWSWKEREIVDAQQGEIIKVKIVKHDKDVQRVQVSRKAALPDPFDYLKTLETGQIIAGRVENVHPIHGLFVEVENDVVLKAGKLSSLEEPVIGDHVSCRVQNIDLDKRRGKVIILNYPRGKRKRKDLGSFLFE